jgi:hypothetical protein
MYITSEKLRLSRISAEYWSAENEPKIMWLAEFLHQPAAVCKKIRLTCLWRMCGHALAYPVRDGYNWTLTPPLAAVT